MKPVVVDSRIARVHPDTDPASLHDAFPEVWWVHVTEPLPPDVLHALVDGFRRYPDVQLRVAGSRIDPSLAMLHDFGHLRKLDLALPDAPTFESLRLFPHLRALTLRDTTSSRLSLAVLRELPSLEHLRLEGHARDFDVVATLEHLRYLALVRNRLTSLQALASHPTLEGVYLSHGRIRDLRPLGHVPRLHDLHLHGIRLFETEDLAPLVHARPLDAVALWNLPRVTALQAFADHASIQFLQLWGMSGLATLAPLSHWPRLQYLSLSASKPHDGRLHPLLRCDSLREVGIGPETYPEEEVAAFQSAFRGSVFWYRGAYLKGQHRGPAYFWQYVDYVRASSDAPVPAHCGW